MTSSVSRRSFVGGSAAAGLGFVFAGSGSVDVFARSAAAATRTATGYGALVADPQGILALPEGFSYRLVARSGMTPTTDGTHPSDPDGMGVFPGADGGSVLVTNHENSGSEPHPVPRVPGVTYDPGASGGTSTIVVDAAGNRLEEYTSLAGTDNNCAGGITPWGTWLTCEETERRAGQGRNTLNHGYVFEVDPTSRAANEGKSAVPLRFLGRYSHEAVAVDPRTSEIYLTEDAGNPNGLYFRWTPPATFEAGKDALRELALSPGGGAAGRLQAMSCYLGSQHVQDLSEATRVGTRYQVEWVDVPDRDAVSVSVRKQFSDSQVTRSRKLEGQWWADGGAFFVSSFARTSDGSAHPHDGQVWFYDPKSETVTLKTIFGVNADTAADNGNFDGPDNITVSPHGGLILAEDGAGVQHLVGVTSQGKAYALARNEYNGSEFCGPAFSADGSTLFVNIQSPGFTLAITGPWGRPSNADV
ncbi:MAG: putative secreted protein [uncultured Friedmanniella sp.]|uniref:Putative secreted protein n=1 Tax=uncultured Friedmanniella sp. TaxID=335381 RepID=A0A6J4KFW3_9ACTN|nr:alkaline phosphatase PhoX [uncultured Friedmanniella sp.]CAA9304606.1 MAG: putative secreted protein [uncultured Friedmanniella sp.]